MFSEQHSGKGQDSEGLRVSDDKSFVLGIWGRSDTKAWFSFALYILVSGIGQLTKSERTDKGALVGSKGLVMLIESGARFPNSASKVSWVLLDAAGFLLCLHIRACS